MTKWVDHAPEAPTMGVGHRADLDRSGAGRALHHGVGIRHRQEHADRASAKRLRAEVETLRRLVGDPEDEFRELGRSKRSRRNHLRGGALAINHVFAGVGVADYESARACLLGRPPDIVPTEYEVVWQLTDRGWIYVVGDVGHSGNALVTLLVDDLERHVSELAERGLATGPIDTVPGLFRRMVINDPEGNVLTFAEDLSTDD
jgi:hypothetical protein